MCPIVSEHDSSKKMTEAKAQRTCFACRRDFLCPLQISFSSGHSATCNELLPRAESNVLTIRIRRIEHAYSHRMQLRNCVLRMACFTEIERAIATHCAEHGEERRLFRAVAPALVVGDVRRHVVNNVVYHNPAIVRGAVLCNICERVGRQLPRGACAGIHARGRRCGCAHIAEQLSRSTG